MVRGPNSLLTKGLDVLGRVIHGATGASGRAAIGKHRDQDRATTTSDGGEALIKRMDNLKIMQGCLGFYGLGQVGVAIRGPEGVIYVDPYLTDYGGKAGRITRNFPPPVSPKNVTNASHVLITHNHVDHFDPETLKLLATASPEARFYGPHTCDFSKIVATSEHVTVPKVGETYAAGDARITAIPSAHTEIQGGELGYPYLGYVVEWNGITVYHAGDTVIHDDLIGMLRRWRIDVMFVPINGRDYFRTARNIIGNTDFREAAELAETLDVALTIPTHYDLFAENSQNPAYFVDYLYRLNADRHHHLLRPGELYYYAKEVP